MKNFKPWDFLSEKSTWVRIAQWRHSFGPKAATLLSVTSFGLAFFGSYLERGNFDIWRLKAWFFGSIFFLIGYVISGRRMPPEFKGGSSDLAEIVRRMTQIQSEQLYTSRKKMAANLSARFKADRRLTRLHGPLTYLDNALAFDDVNNPWSQNAAILFHADVALRQYDRPQARLISALFMGIGLVLLLAPTVTNLVHALLILAGNGR